MAFCTIGNRSDGSWAQGIYEAYLYIQEKYSDIANITFADMIPWGDFPTHLEMQAELGTQLHYLDSAQTWGEALDAVAGKYPDAWYACPGTDAGVIALRPWNVAGYDRAEQEGYFIAGAVAALMSKTGKIGYCVGLDYPEQIRCTSGLELGAKWVNPDAEVVFQVIGTWIDPEKGYETAKAVLATGCDVLAQYADDSGVGVIKAGQEEGVWLIGVVRDMQDFAPDLMLTSVLTDHYLLAERALLDYELVLSSMYQPITP